MATLPKLEVVRVRKLIDDGRHNAFTDLCHFHDRLYLTYRTSPSGHLGQPDSSIVVLTSVDGERWEECHRFAVAGRDLRDAHFLVFRDRLWLYVGSWLGGPTRPGPAEWADLLGFAAWTDDGRHWHGPQAMHDTRGHFIWCAAAWQNIAYLCARRITQAEDEHERGRLVESALLRSDDGLHWSRAGAFDEKVGNETAFLFEQDGSIVAVARTPRHGQICRAQPPYRNWTRVSLGRYIGGPMLERWGEHLLVGGRKPASHGGHETALAWLHENQLHDAAVLPSGGDNAYPGFVALSPKFGLVSYYSSHEGSGTTAAPCSIYLAEVRKH